MANLISENFAAVEAVFEENGFSEAQSQGITAGLAAESNLDPSIQEAGGGPGLGLAQFTTGIQQQAFNSIGGVNSSATDQAQLIADELTGNNSIVNESAAGNSILGTSTPQGALQAFVSQFERPASNTGDITRGTSVLNQLNSGSLTGVSSVDPTFSDLTGQIPDESALGSDPLGSSVSISQDATGSAGTADFGDLPDNIFDGSTAPVTSVASGTAGTAATGVAGAGGAPIDVTDLPGLDTSITGAGKAVQTGAGTIGSDVTSAAGGITGTIASTINSLETYTSSTFVAVALAILGIVFVAFGLGFFKPKQVLSVL
jgi:Phage tail lysozyme